MVETYINTSQLLIHSRRAPSGVITSNQGGDGRNKCSKLKTNFREAVIFPW